MTVGIYENVFIGNFIYALGVKIGINSCQSEFKKEIPACVNLLQQTPIDYKFADLLTSFGGVSFLIEFKSRENKKRKEPKKRDKLDKYIGKKWQMREVSRLAHWFIQVDGSKGVETKVVPYLDMDEQKVLDEAYGFDYFIEKIIEKIFNLPSDREVLDIGVTVETMSKYLKDIAKAFPKGGSQKESLGGLIINVTPDGRLIYVVVNDITQALELTISKIKETTLENGHGIGSIEM